MSTLKGDFNFKYPYIEQDYIGAGISSNSDPQKFSLFGSKLYYLQDKRGLLKEYNRALLFLNTIPWNGNSFESSEILNLFKYKSDENFITYKIWTEKNF